jgi:hypothetical protein
MEAIFHTVTDSFVSGNGDFHLEDGKIRAVDENFHRRERDFCTGNESFGGVDGYYLHN